MGGCPGWEFSWWEMSSAELSLVGIRSGGESFRWEVVLVGSCPGRESFRWGVVQVKSCPGGELSW